jgi:hypothetical protein
MPGFLTLGMEEQRLHKVVLSTIMNQPRKLGTTLCIVMIVMCPLLLMGRILIICGTRLLNISIITMVLQLQLLTTVCVYTEDTDPVLQTVRLHTFLFATGVMGVLFGWLAYVGRSSH